MFKSQRYNILSIVLSFPIYQSVYISLCQTAEQMANMFPFFDDNIVYVHSRVHSTISNIQYNFINRFEAHLCKHNRLI